jgi:formylmethanofuran dehydrogenase subunit E
MKIKHQKIPTNPICSECKFPIVIHQKYLLNDKDGTVLCEECFKKLRKEGKIK